MCEDVELLVVGVLFKRSPTLKAVDDQLQANLSVSYADSDVLLIEWLEAFLPQLYPFLIQLLHVIFDALLIQLEKVHVIRVKEPILSLSF